MITSTRATKEMFDILWNSDLRGEITGEINMYDRPTNSDREEIVINGLPINFEQLQEGVLNVNIHVPNPEYVTVINGVRQKLRDRPNEVRITALEAMFATIFEKPYYKNRIYIELIQQVVLAGEDLKSTFINNRLEIRAKNL